MESRNLEPAALAAQHCVARRKTGCYLPRVVDLAAGNDLSRSRGNGGGNGGCRPEHVDHHDCATAQRVGIDQRWQKMNLQARHADYLPPAAYRDCSLFGSGYNTRADTYPSLQHQLGEFLTASLCAISKDAHAFQRTG
jgi:hypothetical protein